MHWKFVSISLTLLFMLELSTARTIKHQETIFKPNGEKIVRSWTKEVDSDENNFNSGIYIPPHFEDTQNGADGNDEIIITRGLTDKNFGLEAFSDNEFNIKESQNESPWNVKKGLFEEAWDLEPDYEPNSEIDLEPASQTVPEPQALPLPSRRKNLNENRRNVLDLAQHSNFHWKPIVDDNVYDGNNFLGVQPKHTNFYRQSFNTNTGIHRWPVIQQPKTSWHVTKTYESKPGHVIHTNSYHGPQTTFTWPTNYGDWTPINKEPKSLNELIENALGIIKTTSGLTPPMQTITTTTTPLPSTKTSTTAKTTSTFGENPITLDELIKQLYSEETITTATTTTTTTPPSQEGPSTLDELMKSIFQEETKTKTPQTIFNSPITTPKPVTTIDIKDLPIAEILNNGQPIDETYLKSLPEQFRPYEQTLHNIRDSFDIQNIPMSIDSVIEPIQIPPTPNLTIEPPPPPQPILPLRTTTTTTTPLPIPPRPSLTFLPPFLPKETQPMPANTKTTPASPSTLSKTIYSIGSSTTQIKPQGYDFESDIEQFLNKVDLSKMDSDFEAPGRTITKTIVDKNGDILTATFMLSSVQDREAAQNKSDIDIKPLK